MAKAAAPYLHPTLSSIEHTGDTEEFRKAADMPDEELAAIVAGAKLTVVTNGRRLRSALLFYLANEPSPSALGRCFLNYPSKFLREILMLGRRRRSRVLRRVSNVPFFKFHQLGNHREARLQVGHPRIVFISELLNHPLKVNSSSLDLILN